MFGVVLKWECIHHQLCIICMFCWQNKVWIKNKFFSPRGDKIRDCSDLVNCVSMQHWPQDNTQWHNLLSLHYLSDPPFPILSARQNTWETFFGVSKSLTETLQANICNKDQYSWSHANLRLITSSGDDRPRESCEHHHIRVINKLTNDPFVRSCFQSLSIRSLTWGECPDDGASWDAAWRTMEEAGRGRVASTGAGGSEVRITS